MKQREIKFRAWVKSTERMLLWDDLQMEELWAILHKETEGYVLMQYTNLKDKNGKEIYEGDIVMAEDWDEDKKDYMKKYIVEWFDGNFALRLIGSKKPIKYQNIVTYIEKVIGNIYEIPNLITL